MDINTIIKLAKGAEKGDQSALKALLQENRKQALIANKRLKRLKESGYEDRAVSRKAHDFTESATGTSYFTTSAKLLKNDISLLKRNLIQAQKVNSAVTGSVRGIKKYEAKVAEHFYEIMGHELTAKQRKAFFDFLESGIFSNIKKFDSDRFFDDVLDAFTKGASVAEFKKAWNEYEKSEDKFEKDIFDTVVDKYKGIK